MSLALNTRQNRSHAGGVLQLVVVGGLAGVVTIATTIWVTYELQVRVQTLYGMYVAFAGIGAGVVVALLSRSGLRIPTHIFRKRKMEVASLQTARLALAGEITASIIHEVAQPLSSTLINVETLELLLARGDVAGAVEVARDIKREQRRASVIVQRLRGLVLGAPTRFENLDIDETIASVLALLRTDLARRNVAVRTHLNARSHILADSVQLQQALLNLFACAIEAMNNNATPGVLEVTSFSDSQHIEVTVGDGSAASKHFNGKQVVKSWFTGKATSASLGLSLTSAIVKAHRGALRVESNLSGGASFHFTIPSAAAAEAIRSRGRLVARADSL